MSKRDEFIRKMKDRLDGWNLEIDALEERFRKIKTDMTDKYQVPNRRIAQKAPGRRPKTGANSSGRRRYMGAFESRKRTRLERNEGCARGFQVSL